VQTCLPSAKVFTSLQFLIVALAIVGLALAAEKDGEATIVDGSEKVAEYFTQNGYDYKFKTSNTIVKQEQLDLGNGIVTGEYEYVDPEGELLIAMRRLIDGE
jgi:Insect cuticle protein